uniref:splicing factor 3B subunit 4-like n=1 Tax=Fragaria vesca subsp. vesca TaxID=101020 RepID=UPI0005C7F265|nr:PREDICTED: splicing factor 3B subunit 4-like [Fragaria vesca subsp. vesca]
MTTRIALGVGANNQHSAYVGNLDSRAAWVLLVSLLVRLVKNCTGSSLFQPALPDRVTNLHQGYGFVEFQSEKDADHAIKVLNMI